MYSKLSDGERGDVSADDSAGMGVHRSRQRPCAHLRVAARLVRARSTLPRPTARQRPRRVPADG